MTVDGKKLPHHQTLVARTMRDMHVQNLAKEVGGPFAMGLDLLQVDAWW